MMLVSFYPGWQSHKSVVSPKQQLKREFLLLVQGSFLIPRKWHLTPGSLLYFLNDSFSSELKMKTMGTRDVGVGYSHPE